MKRAALNFWLVALALAGAVDCAAAPDRSISGPPEFRTIQFPSTASIGSLLLVSSDLGAGEEAVAHAMRVGIARGSVNVRIPAGRILLLEANRVVFENPACLNQIEPPAIDALKMGFQSMSDEEEGRCDRALKYIRRFKKLMFLDVEQSDATDAGLADLKSLTNLRGITAVESRVNGTFLKDLSGLPHLFHIKLDRCTLDQSNFAYLPTLKNLSSLRLRWANIDVRGVKHLAGCTALTTLDLSRNKKIDDGSMKYLSNLKKLNTLYLNETSIGDVGLQQLQNLHELTDLNLEATKITDAGLKNLAGFKKLTSLDLAKTKLTVAGLKSLQGLRLAVLNLPGTQYSAAEMKNLKQIFPQTYLRMERNLSHDLDQMYGPIPE